MGVPKHGDFFLFFLSLFFFFFFFFKKTTTTTATKRHLNNNSKKKKKKKKAFKTSPHFKVYRFSHEGKSYNICIPYHKCENHTVTFFEKREESCHQKRDMPLVSFGLNISIFCCKHIYWSKVLTDQPG